jgi:hypothetical protein
VGKLIYNIVIIILFLVASLMAGYFWSADLVVAQIDEIEEEEDETPPKILNVSTSQVTATSSVITWTTDEMADSLVNFGLDKRYGVVRDPLTDKTEHTILLDGLLSDATYYFRITSSDEDGNQGISNDFSFTTLSEEQETIDMNTAEEMDIEGEGGLMEEILTAGEGGLSEQGIKEIIRAIREISQEEILEEIVEEVQDQAQEVVLPPTIILDYADVEVGTDYAIISWKTDKDSNTMVALAEEGDYNENYPENYVWNEGVPDELVKDHVVYVNGLRPATTYHFQVSSESVVGLTGKSEDKTFRTKSITPEIFNLQVTKIEEEAATVRWSTNVPCSAIIEYTNLNNNNEKLEGNNAYLTVHNIRLTNLIFDTYYSVVVRVESEDGEKTESEPITFITSRDKYAPEISKVNTESTIYPGSENRIQTIASWYTDEAAQCQLYYHQGLFSVDEPQFQPKEEDYGLKHVQVITNFLPSAVYKFWIVCNDEAGNDGKSEDFTMLTPSQEESIIDIIIKNFESSFGWVKKMKI